MSDFRSSAAKGCFLLVAAPVVGYILLLILLLLVAVLGFISLLVFTKLQDLADHPSIVLTSGALLAAAVLVAMVWGRSFKPLWYLLGGIAGLAVFGGVWIALLFLWFVLILPVTNFWGSVTFIVITYIVGFALTRNWN